MGQAQAGRTSNQDKLKRAGQAQAGRTSNQDKLKREGHVEACRKSSSGTRAVEVSGLVLKFRAWDFCFKWDRSDLLWSIPVDVRSVVLLARSEVPWGLQNLRCRG
jgi:hypothetical protein